MNNIGYLAVTMGLGASARHMPVICGMVSHISQHILQISLVTFRSFKNTFDVIILIISTKA
jgi:hypothetical protein